MLFVVKKNESLGRWFEACGIALYVTVRRGFLPAYYANQDWFRCIARRNRSIEC